jgi:glycosyltransferase involved in cell wall biosynthesis
MALLLGSTHDQWGMTVNEALAAGAPVLCSSRAGAHEVVRNHVNGYTFHPWDEEHLAELMYALAKDEAAVERLRGNAAASVQDFSVQQWLEACMKEIPVP